MVGELRRAGMLSKTIVTRPGRPAGHRRARVLPALAFAVVSGLALGGLGLGAAAAARPAAVAAFSPLPGHSVNTAIPGVMIIGAHDGDEPMATPAVRSAVSLPAGRLGRSYRRNLVGQGGMPRYRLTLESGALPAGLTLSEDGVVSGTPTESGDWSFTVRLVDMDGRSATQVYQLRIVGSAPLRLPSSPGTTTSG